MTAAKAPAHRLVASLQAGERIEDCIYRVQQKDLRTTTNGGLYIHAVLADRSGQMLARMWNATQTIYDSIPEGGFLHFRGRVENYKGNVQFIIDGLRAVEPGAVDPSDFLPTTTRDVEKLWSRLVEIMGRIQNTDLRALVQLFLEDPQFVAEFKRAPAAVQLHHAYLGGLLEHTLSLLELALVVLPRYPQVSADLVLTALLLHDAGKTRELTYATNFGYSNEGQLIGHIVQVIVWAHEKAALTAKLTSRPFPPELLMSLKHIILAHHGQYDFGSPKLPATPEAVMVHYLDNLDAKLQLFFQLIEKDTDAASDWTNYVPSLQTKIFKPDVLGIRGSAPR